jgi:hypothetical protein
MKYEPPVLVDMKGPGLCGEFVSCIAGSKVAKGSCYEDNKCNTGTGAEQCQNGQSACGCDACCGIGNFFTTRSGYPCNDCACAWGSVAYYNCSGGSFALTQLCQDGYYATTSMCQLGDVVGGGMQQCEPGA